MSSKRPEQHETQSGMPAKGPSSGSQAENKAGANFRDSGSHGAGQGMSDKIGQQQFKERQQRQEHDKKANWSADAQGSAANQMTSDSSAELLRGSGKFPEGRFGTQQQGGFQQASSSGIGPNPGGISGNFPQGIFGTQPQGGFQKASQQRASSNRAGSTNVEGGLSGGLWTEPQQLENFQEDYTSAGANLGGISSTDGAGRETFQQGLTSERGSNLGGFQGSDLAGKENVPSTSDKHRLGGIAQRDADQPLLSSGGNTRTNARTSGRRH
jgi:hypothetical protein